MPHSILRGGAASAETFNKSNPRGSIGGQRFDYATRAVADGNDAASFFDKWLNLMCRDDDGSSVRQLTG